MGDTPQRHKKAQTPPPESLHDAEATATHDVRMLITNTDRSEASPETAYNALISDYQDFKKTHNAKEVQQYVTDLEKTFKDNKWLPDLAVAMGYDKLSDKSVYSRLSPAQLDALAKDNDPLTAMLGRELKADVASIKATNPYTKQEGGMWLTGWGSHEAPGLGRNDLNSYLDPIERGRRTRNMGEDLQDGLFDQVAKFAKINPDKDDLHLDDFVGYLNTNSKKLSPQDTDRLRRIIENWGNVSLNVLADHDGGATILSKKSIAAGLKDLGPEQ